MRNHENLYLACNTKVDKVIIENGRAVGVQVVPTKPLSPDQVGQNRLSCGCHRITLFQQGSRIFGARKQIVVSGGTLSSPLILQRSGIGKKLSRLSTRQFLSA